MMNDYTDDDKDEDEDDGQSSTTEANWPLTGIHKPSPREHQQQKITG